MCFPAHTCRQRHAPNGWHHGRWAAGLYSHSGEEKGSSESGACKSVIIPENYGEISCLHQLRTKCRNKKQL